MKQDNRNFLLGVFQSAKKLHITHALIWKSGVEFEITLWTGITFVLLSRNNYGSVP